MRAALITAALLLVSCAAPETPTQQGNQPHLPPPDFLVSEASDDAARSCGVRRVGGEETCETGEFCRREIEDICGAADAPGVCSPIPEACTQNYMPVCGCDGKTYSNECAANSKGISASYVGTCKP